MSLNPGQRKIYGGMRGSLPTGEREFKLFKVIYLIPNLGSLPTGEREFKSHPLSGPLPFPAAVAPHRGA